MSIEDFEDTLRSDLRCQMKEAGIDALYFDKTYRRQSLGEESSELLTNELNGYMRFDPTHSCSERYLLITGISRFERFCKEHGFIVNLLARHNWTIEKDWWEAGLYKKDSAFNLKQGRQL